MEGDYDGPERRRENRKAMALASEARDIAMKALNRIDAHEGICAERWKHVASVMQQVADSMADMRKDIRSLSNRWMTAGGVVISVLVVALGYMLAANGLPGAQ